MSTSLEKDLTIHDVRSVCSDDSSYLEYTPLNSHIDTAHNINSLNYIANQSAPRRHSFSATIPRYLQLDNIRKLLNKPCHDSRRLNPALYHSLTNSSECHSCHNHKNEAEHIYDSYNHYEEDKSYRHKIENSDPKNLKYIKHQLTQEEILLNKKMIDDFWLEGNIPDEMDFDVSSDEEEDVEEKKLK